MIESSGDGDDFRETGGYDIGSGPDHEGQRVCGGLGIRLALQGGVDAVSKETVRDQLRKETRLGVCLRERPGSSFSRE